MKLNINTTAALKFTNKLEKMHKSALPVAVRGAINKAAFDVKQSSLLKTAEDTFVKRQPNFFKANSRVEMAKGFDLKSMKSTVGMTSTGLKGGSTNFAVKDLEQQEHGGRIGGRSFIPTKQARVGQGNNGSVRAGNRLSAIQKMISVKNAKGKTWAQKAIKSAVHAGVGGVVMNPGNPGGMVWRITSIKRSGGNTRFTKVNLYSYTKNRDVKVKATHFMKRASTESAKRIEEFYIEEAKRQIAKLK